VWVRGERPGAGEIGLLATPGALAAVALHLLGALALPAMALGVALSVAAAVALALWRTGAAARLARWADDVAHGTGPPHPPEVAGPLGVHLRPLAELGRGLEAERQRSRDLGRLLETLVEALPDPLLLIDRDLLVTRANAAAHRALGFERAGIPLGRALRDPGVLAAVGAALGAGEASATTFSPVGDRGKQFAARIEPILLDDGRRGALLALREQTEQVMIERMRSDFVANASHEIRTPLASLIGFIETLRGPARDDAAARDSFLATMAEEATRMARLIDDLLSLSRIELAANRPPAGRVDPAILVQEVAERMTPHAERRRVRLELDLEPDLPTVRGDADQLHQLLVNLVDNAIKYGGQGKTVRIEVLRLATGGVSAGALSGRACVAIAIVDQGEGIAAEHIPRITERFYRVDSARSRRLGGTGLGLAIAKHVVRRHQGHLQILSEPGRGSRFTVLLPLAPTVGGVVDVTEMS
jgi:two-component system phosphate regulon sensor histidine kinase PhoR